MNPGGIETKTCQACGETFAREGASGINWTKRRYCNVDCRAFAYQRKRRPGLIGGPITTPEAFASREMLKLLLRYGLRNDGLPGLPANDLLRLAAELGVAA